MNQIRENIVLVPMLSITIIASAFVFLFKGISYLIIGSSIPFLLGFILLALIGFAFKKRNRTSRRIFRSWAWLLVMWGVARLAIELMFVLSSVTEAHIQNQFTFAQRLLSIGAIFMGAYIIRKVRLYQEMAA